MVQLKTFNQFISKENSVNEGLEGISEENRKVLEPILKEFGKFLTGESYDKNIKRGLIIRSHTSNIIKKIFKDVNSEYPFDSYWIGARALTPKSIYNTLRDGNNQCIVFNDCEPSYLSSPKCIKILTSVFSDKNRYCARIPFDSVENTSFGERTNHHNLNFRGTIIIICDNTKNTISKELLDKFEFIDLTK